MLPARAAAIVLGVMGLLAAMQAVTGICGMTSYSLSRRMKEHGIRIALGAQQVQVLGSALGRPLLLLVAGSVTGLGIGAVANPLLGRIIYQATSSDPAVLGGVSFANCLFGMLATLVPGRHVLTIDPARLLRD